MEVWLFLSGYMINFFASSILVYKMHQCKSTYGLSIDTQICFLISTLSRCLWSHDTRLVETWLAYAELCCSTLMAAFLVYKMMSYTHTKAKTVPWYLSSAVLISAAMVMALLIHPGNAFISMQILVAFTIYLEAVCLLPQLFIMHRTIEIESMTSRYVALISVSRILRLLFWLQLYMQGDSFIGLFVADALHCILSVDYVVQWFNRLRQSSGRLLLKR